MKFYQEITSQAIQLFEPDPDAIYTLEVAERLAHVPRRRIVVYYKHGLVSPVADPAYGGFYFMTKASVCCDASSTYTRSVALTWLGSK
jgi:hypothetical protein